MAGHVPSAGDIVWAELSPTLGTEQSGRRPALVVTPRRYNESSTRVLVCPITSVVRGWPLEVPLPASTKTVGCILVDQIRSIDRAARIFRHIEAVPEDVLGEVVDRLMSLLRA